MKRLLPFLFLTLIWLAGMPAKADGGIEWLGGDLPPFIWKEGGSPRGYGVELIVAMAERQNRQAVVDFYPWARAVATARNGDRYGVLPLARTPDREAHFRWLIRLAHVDYTFFARHDGGIARQVDDLEALRTRRIGVLRGSPIIANLQAEHFTRIVSATNYAELLRLLDVGSIDAAYAGRPMMTAAIAQSGYPGKHFVTGVSLGDADLYIGTSLKLDAHEAERWLQAYRALLADGTVTRLRRKYDLPPL